MAWKIEKNEAGNAWVFSSGIAGTPYYREVTGLSQHQAEGIERVIGSIERRTKHETQASIREALGISEKAAK